MTTTRAISRFICTGTGPHDCFDQPARLLAMARVLPPHRGFGSAYRPRSRSVREEQLHKPQQDPHCRWLVLADGACEHQRKIWGFHQLARDRRGKGMDGEAFGEHPDELREGAVFL